MQAREGKILTTHDIDQGRHALFPPVECDKEILDTDIFIVVNTTYS